MVTYGKMLENILVEPISAKAVVVRKGEVIRVIQEEGGQCVDMNVFNMHDYREFMDTSIMRRQGFHLGKGDFLISNSPRNRLMMQILDKSPVNIIDILVHRCSAAYCEANWGYLNHTNCQDLLAEAIREYGLTPDDTHAVLCPWTPTDWNRFGKFKFVDRGNRDVKKGDYFDMIALMDVLVASCICGITGETSLGNYWPRPIRIQVFESSPETVGLIEKISRQYPPLKNQKTTKDFLLTRGEDKDFEIKKLPGYKPQYTNFPLEISTIEVELNKEDYEQIQKQVEHGLRDDAEDALRTAVLEWYLKNRTKRHPLAGTVHG